MNKTKHLLIALILGHSIGLLAQRNYLISTVEDKPNVDGTRDEAFWESVLEVSRHIATDPAAYCAERP